jgi:hypothetical protein
MSSMRSKFCKTTKIKVNEERTSRHQGLVNEFNTCLTEKMTDDFKHMKPLKCQKTDIKLNYKSLETYHVNYM